MFSIYQSICAPWRSGRGRKKEVCRVGLVVKELARGDRISVVCHEDVFGQDDLAE